jgi:CMP-N,N'-diacetyllegionaminic acid synthase
MKFLAIIPARGGSKGVPRKNIKLLGGKPLIWYSYEAARVSGLFSEIVISTDDVEIAEIAKEIGILVPFLRPNLLANDSAKSIDVVIHCLTEMEKLGFVYDGVVLLQPTSPFREKGLIKKSIEIFQQKNADSLVSVRKVPHQFNPHWLFETNSVGLLKIATGDTELIPRRQELPDAYYRDGQIYITSKKVLLDKQSFIGDKLAYVLNENEGSTINIDHLEDWISAEKYINENKIEF